MDFHHVLNRTPLAKTFTGKLFAVAFVGTHLPILALIAYLILWQPGATSWPLLVGIVLVATLAGTVWAFVALFGLLRPIREAAHALAAFNQGGAARDTSFPLDHPDEVGRMLRELRRTMDDNRRMLRSLRSQANVDPMTGALNRRGLQENIDQWQIDQPASLIVMDLDNLKRLNDEHGHHVGDRALCLLSDTISEQSNDEECLLARWGGDEFVLVLKQSPEQAASHLDSILRSVKQASRDTLPVPLSVSAGLAPFSSKEEFDQAHERADQAMYESKRKANGRIEIVES